MPMLLRLPDTESQENQERLITQSLTTNSVALHVTLERLISYAIGDLGLSVGSQRDRMRWFIGEDPSRRRDDVYLMGV